MVAVGLRGLLGYGWAGRKAVMVTLTRRRTASWEFIPAAASKA